MDEGELEELLGVCHPRMIRIGLCYGTECSFVCVGICTFIHNRANIDRWIIIESP